MPRQAEKPGNTPITNFRLPPETLAELDAVVEASGVGSRTAIIKSLIRQAFRKLRVAEVRKEQSEK